MAETIEQWYQMIEETYNKWESQLAQLKSEKLLADSILQKDDLERDQIEELSRKITLLNNNINSIIPTVQKYKYYLDFKEKSTPTPTTSEITQD